MSAKPIRRVKHVPQRTCVGCHEVKTKRELIRVVRTPEGVMIDPSGKLSGRGAYLHRLASCWEIGLKGALARALKTELTETDKERLQTFLVTLPKESADTSSNEDSTQAAKSEQL